MYYFLEKADNIVWDSEKDLGKLIRKIAIIKGASLGHCCKLIRIVLGGNDGPGPTFSYLYVFGREEALLRFSNVLSEYYGNHLN